MSSILFALSLVVTTSQFLHSYNPCRLEDASTLVQCSCLPDDSSLLITCDNARLAGVPPLPKATPISLSFKNEQLLSLPPNSFSGAELISLDLYNNGLKSVSANAFRGLERDQTSLEESLQTLKISSNKLSELPTWAFAYLSTLETLDVSSNNIRVLRNKAFDETTLSSLRFLYLHDNQIEIIPTQCLRKLRVLVLSLAGNRVNSVEKLSLPRTLTILDLTANLLQEIPYLALAEQSDLREINLEGNRISKTDYNAEVMLSNELKLTLRNNRITTVSADSFKSFRKFVSLDMSHNEISKVSPYIFETVSAVKELNLAHNKITSLAKGTFENVGKSMESLNVAWNEMHILPEALTDLRVLKSLNLDGNKMSSLSLFGLASFRESLVELSVSYNHLTSVPEEVLQAMPALRVIDLSKNKITTVTATWRIGHLTKVLLAANLLTSIEQQTFFANSPSLTFLDLSFNRIEKLGMTAFRTLLALDTFFLQHNRLASLPREALISQTALHTFVLDHNYIDTLPPQSTAPWPRLARLSMSGNRIGKVDERAFSSAFSLKYLDLSRNAISVLKSHTFQLLRLGTILLSRNELRAIHAMFIAHISEMRRLDLSHNKLKIIPTRAIYNVSSIDRLSFSHNQLEYIEADAFHEVRRIGRLDLSKNRLKIFACSVFNLVPRIEELDLLELSCLKSSLSNLDLSHNELQTLEEELLEGAQQLSSLSLSHNALLSVNSNAFSTLPSLSSINLSNNHIRILRKGTFAKQRFIMHLNLSNNALVSMHPDVLGTNNVFSLSLSGNQLASLPVEGIRSVAVSLVELDLSENYLTSIEADQLGVFPSIRRLNLARNRLHSLEEDTFSTLPLLEYLDLSHNPFSSWHPQAFKGLSDVIMGVSLARTGLFSLPRLDTPELESLDLSGNNIREIEAPQLDGLRNLRSLNLSTNSISTLADRLFSNLTSLTELNLSSNPLHALTDQHLRDLPRLSTLILNDLSSLYALPNPESFALLTSMRHLEMTSLPSGIINYNVSAMLSSLPPLHTVAVQINEPVLDGQLLAADPRALRRLTVTGRILRQIEPRAFQHIRGFEVDLTITNTNISSFPSTIFDTLTSVQRLSLNLDDNQLTTLRPFTYTQPPLLNRHATLLTSISIKNNPLVCDCSLAWLSSPSLHSSPNPCPPFRSSTGRDTTCTGPPMHPVLTLILLLLVFLLIQ